MIKLKMKICNEIAMAISFSLALAGCDITSYSDAHSNHVATTVNAYATPTLVAYNGTAVITWTSTNSTSCTSLPTGINGTAGSFTTPALLGSTIYTVSCTGSTGSVSQKVTIGVGSSSIVAVVNAWAATPLRGTVHYYCDCGTGATGSPACIPGSDTNDGLTTATPKRTIAAAMANFATLSSGDTVALCKGGAFDSNEQYSIGSIGRCTVGDACNDLRDFTPTTFTATAKPILNSAYNGAFFNFSGGRSGIRFLNLSMNNLLNPNHGTATDSSRVVFIYEKTHDITFGNVDLNGFLLALYSESDAGNNFNIKVTGNTFSNNTVMGWLGGADNLDVSYNVFVNTGSDTGGDHAIYLYSHALISNVNIIGNDIRGQSSPTCYGAMMVAHVAVDGLNVNDNYLQMDTNSPGGGCWGISFENITGGSFPVYHRNAVFSGNTIVNTGNVSLSVSSCPSCVIKNNLIIQNWAYNGNVVGIDASISPPRPGIADDTNSANKIVNNTIWFGPNSTGSPIGILTEKDNVSAIIANNAIKSDQTAAGTLSCFQHTLPLASYAFINNNACYSANHAYKWELTQGTLAQWKVYAAARAFDNTASFEGDPMFTAAGTDFKPAGGSPLIGAGNTTYGSSHIGAFAP